MNTMDTCTWAPSDRPSSADSASSLFSQPSSCPTVHARNHHTQSHRSGRSHGHSSVPVFLLVLGSVEVAAATWRSYGPYPCLLPRGTSHLDSMSLLEGNSVSALGRQIMESHFSLKKYAKYKNSLVLGKFNTLVTGLRV